MTTTEQALTAFDANNISVAAALAHLHATVDRAHLLALRQARRVDGVREAQRLLEPFPSAILRVAFVAEPYAAVGAHAEALAAFLEALPHTPRWDSALAARVLGGTASALTALGRAEEAVVVSSRTLRFMPAEPRTVAAHAVALEAAGRSTDAAAHFAWLHDIGVGKAVLPRDALELESEVDAYAPSLDGLEPLDDEGMARHLILSFADLGLANHCCRVGATRWRASGMAWTTRPSVRSRRTQGAHRARSTPADGSGGPSAPRTTWRPTRCSPSSRPRSRR